MKRLIYNILSGQDSTGKTRTEDVYIGFLINKSILKSCTIEPNLNKTIEFMSIKLNLTNNESMMVCLYYGKEESRSTKKQSENKFNQIYCIDNNSYVLILGDFNTCKYM